MAQLFEDKVIDREEFRDMLVQGEILPTAAESPDSAARVTVEILLLAIRFYSWPSLSTRYCRLTVPTSGNLLIHGIHLLKNQPSLLQNLLLKNLPLKKQRLVK